MKLSFYIHVFAGISVTALCLQLFSDFWLPMAIGVLAMIVVTAILRN
jgi:hypothetical protein